MAWGPPADHREVQMAAKLRFHRLRSTSRASARRRPPRRRRRVAIVAIATSTAILAFCASASLADTGSVYFDGAGNAAAGGTLFGNFLPGAGNNVGLGFSVLTNDTTGSDNV